jgi:hypothetical protein
MTVLSWFYSRYVGHLQIFSWTSWTYRRHSDNKVTTVELSETKNFSPFIKIFFDTPISVPENRAANVFNTKRIGNVLIKDFDIFSEVFHCYHRDRYTYMHADDISSISIEFDRIYKRVIVRSDAKIYFSVINGGSIIECNGCRIIINKKNYSEIFIKENSVSLFRRLTNRSESCSGR